MLINQFAQIAQVSNGINEVSVKKSWKFNWEMVQATNPNFCNFDEMMKK